ncbi:MAG: DUF459 domain-containing protein [Actinobacteria bacterium]|nr:DUF459 domain-containing protein [Actinomycetota bacterium]
MDRFVEVEPEVDAVAEPHGPARSSAGRVLVVLTVCLFVWAVLAAPILERNAEAGPVGARRTAALAVLRPLLAISDALLLSRATGTVERALGRDPEGQPGGELSLPDLDLPPEIVEPLPTETMPAEPSPASPLPVQDPEPSLGAEPAAGAAEEEAPPEEPADIRVPTASNKLRVAVIGDSLAQGIGPAIERWMDPEVARVLSLGRISTGLSRQDYFNWQAGMRQIVEAFRPDLVFVMLGSNDAQAQIARDGSEILVGSVEWVEGYRERAAALLREATRAGTRVVWVGIPVVEERQRWDFYRRVNGIYRETASSDPLGTYVDAWSAFEARDGGYAAFIRNERGELQLMRASDGIHFTPAGYASLARIAIRAAADAFGLPQEAATFRL